jgi:hypothetical protein
MTSRATTVLPWFLVFFGVLFYIRTARGGGTVWDLVRGVGLSPGTAGCVPVVGIGLAAHPPHAGGLRCEPEGVVLVHGHDW